MSSKNTVKPSEYIEEYRCVDCGNVQKMKSTQPVLCTICHCRIFRKVRTRYQIQFLAR